MSQLSTLGGLAFALVRYMSVASSCEFCCVKCAVSVAAAIPIRQPTVELPTRNVWDLDPRCNRCFAGSIRNPPMCGVYRALEVELLHDLVKAIIDLFIYAGH